MRILYLSAHSILEADEVTLLQELEHEVFSPGAYVEPANPGNPGLRPHIFTTMNPQILEQYNKIGAKYPGEDAKNFLTKGFVDNFDAVIIMHLPRWVTNNWLDMKHKFVIWRSIGQSTQHIEAELKPYRKKGLKVMRYSPKEKSIPGYVGEDAMIRFYKDENEWTGWTGETKEVITVAQSMKDRGDFCNFGIFDKATRDFPRKLYGTENKSSGIEGGQLEYEVLKSALRASRVYFYAGTQPASYTLGFIEALMTGIPIVSIGPRHGNKVFSEQQTFEIDSIIQNHVNGFWSDNPEELSNYIKQLLEDDVLAQKISQKGRQTAKAIFGKNQAKADWAQFLDSL